MVYKPPGKMLVEDDLDDILEENGMDLPEWVDDFLSFLTGGGQPGARKGVNFRILNKQFWLTLPAWTWDAIEEACFRENIPKQQFAEAAIVMALLLRVKAWKELGDTGTTGLKLQAIKRQLMASRVMRDIEHILELVEGDSRFWLEQQRPASLAKAISQLVDAVEGIKDPDLKSAAIKYSVDNWEWARVGATYLADQGHPQGLVLDTSFQFWEAQVHGNKQQQKHKAPKEA